MKKLAIIALAAALAASPVLAENPLHKPAAKLDAAAEIFKSNYIEHQESEGNWPLCECDRGFYNALVKFTKATAALHTALDEGETCHLARLVAYVESTGHNLEELAEDADLCSDLQNELDRTIARSCAFAELYADYAEAASEEEEVSDHGHDHDDADDHGHDHDEDEHAGIEFGNEHFRIRIPLGE